MFVCFEFDVKNKGCKSRTKQVGLDQTSSFCKAEETVNTMKRQSTEMGENICKSDKRQISKICLKNSHNLISKIIIMIQF